MTAPQVWKKDIYWVLHIIILSNKSNGENIIAYLKIFYCSNLLLSTYTKIDIKLLPTDVQVWEFFKFFSCCTGISALPYLSFLNKFL